MIEIDTEETKTCEECPTILDIDDFFLCQDCEEEVYERDNHEEDEE